MKAISVSQKKRGRPATGETPRLGVRLPDDLQSVIADQATDLGITKSDAIREALKEWATAHSLLESKSGERPVLFRLSDDMFDRVVEFAARHDMAWPDALPIILREFFDAEDASDA